MRVLLLAVVMALLLAMLAAPAFAAQPNQECTPGAFPGSGSNGFDRVAEGHYANPDSQGGMSSGNPKVVSQYDVACAPHPK